MGTDECGVIVIYKENPTTAIIQNIQGKDNCYESTIDKTNDGKMNSNTQENILNLCLLFKIILFYM